VDVLLTVVSCLPCCARRISLVVLIAGFVIPVVWFAAWCMLCRKDQTKKASAYNCASTALITVALQLIPIILVVGNFNFNQ